MSANLDTKLFQEHYYSLSRDDRKKLRSILCNECGVNEQTVWAWAAGRRFPKLSSQKIIAKATEIPLNQLFPAI